MLACHFLGFIQYELKAYLQRFGGADLRHLQRYLTRFDGADKAYLSTNLETLFAHLIHKDEAALNTLWSQADAKRDTAADLAANVRWRCRARRGVAVARADIVRAGDRPRLLAVAPDGGLVADAAERPDSATLGTGLRQAGDNSPGWRTDAIRDGGLCQVSAAELPA